MKPGVRWSVRAAEAADEPLMRQIYASTRAAELAATGWDEATCERFVAMQFNAQRTHYEQTWPQARLQVIEVHTEGGLQAAGRLWVDDRPGSLHVLDIAILPHCQGQGLGQACLERLQQQARARGLGMSIYVEQGNPARRLYHRLGFVEQGEPVGIHQYMVWQDLSVTQQEPCDEQA